MRISRQAAAALLVANALLSVDQVSGEGASKVNLSYDSDAPAECPTNPTGRSFTADTTGPEGCHNIVWTLETDDSGEATRSVEMLTCPSKDGDGGGGGKALDIISSNDLETGADLSPEERIFLCGTADSIEGRVDADVLRNETHSLEAQVVRASRLLCAWPAGLSVSYVLETNAEEGLRVLDFVDDGEAPPGGDDARRDMMRRKLAAVDIATGTIRSLCAHEGEYLESTDGASRAKVEASPPCGDTANGMSVYDGTAWTCLEKSDGAPYYGQPNPPKWSSGNCFGRCGSSIGGGTGSGMGCEHMPSTADCADLEFCLRFDINDVPGQTPYDCRSLFVNAIDDWMFGVACDDKEEVEDEVTTTATLEPETDEIINLVSPPVVVARMAPSYPWWGWRRYSSNRDFVPYTLDPIGTPDAFDTCDDLEEALRNAAAYLVNRAVKRQAGYAETNDDAYRRCDPWGYYDSKDMYYRLPQKSSPIMMADSAESSSTSGLDDSFETNNQEEGVQEGDLIKSDGSIIVAAYGDDLFLFDVDTLEVLNQLTYSYNGTLDVLSSVQVDDPTVETFYPNAVIKEEDLDVVVKEEDLDVVVKEEDQKRLRYKRDLRNRMKGVKSERDLSMIMPYYGRMKRPPRIVALLLDKTSRRLTVVLEVSPPYKNDGDPTKTIMSVAATTIVRVYDISTPTAPTLVGSRRVGGSYVALRSIGSVGHVVTNAWIDQTHYLTDYFDRCRDEFKTTVEVNGTNTTEYMNRTQYVDAIQQTVVPDIISSFVERLKDELLSDGGSCETIVKITTFDSSTGNETADGDGDGGDDSTTYQPAEVLRNFVRITSFEVDQETSAVEQDDGDEPLLVADRAGLFVPSASRSYYVYSSEDVLVVPLRGSDRDPVTGSWKASTLMYAFALQKDGSAATPFGVAKVPGSADIPGSLDQFAFDEYKGHLRVATTNNAEWGCVEWDDVAEMKEELEPTRCSQWGRTTVSTSQVTVLKLPESPETSQVMETVSIIDELGPDERIYAVRFMNTKAFVVTFRQTDPFYSIDWSDGYIDAPPVGELANITGFSNYLHPFNPEGTIILAVGQEADQNGRGLGLQISLFDVRDLADPKLLHKYHKGKGVSSDAQSDHKAFRFIPRNDDDSGVLILPVYERSNDRLKGNYDGFRLYNVSLTTGIAPLLDIPHATNEEFFWCWNNGGSLPSRSFVIDGNLVTTKKRSIVKTNLDTQDWEIKVNMERDVNTGCWYYW